MMSRLRDDVAIGLVGISQPLAERFDAVGEQHRRLGRDHHRAEPGAAHDQALIHQDAQRLAHGLAAGRMRAINSVSVGSRFADRIAAEPDVLLQFWRRCRDSATISAFRVLSAIAIHRDVLTASTPAPPRTPTASPARRSPAPETAACFSIASAKASSSAREHIDRGISAWSAARWPDFRRTSVISSSTSAEPLRAEHMDPPVKRRRPHGRQRAGDATGKIERDHGGIARRRPGLARIEAAHRPGATGPSRLTKASSTCRPAPVSPPPGDSSGDNRQPSVTLLRVLVAVVAFDMKDACRARRSRRCRAAPRIDGQKRRLCPTASTTPASRQASNMRAASARCSASGFSQNTCLRAAAQAITCARCSECGVASSTASMAGSREHRVQIVGQVEIGVRRKSPARAAMSGSTAADDFQPRAGRARPRRGCGPSGRGRRSRSGSSGSSAGAVTAGSLR